MVTHISKEQFLVEHNKLSPAHLQATLALLTKFQEAKKPLLKNDEWSIDKLRIPFIAWLTSLPEADKKDLKKGKKEKETYKNYPETHYES